MYHLYNELEYHVCNELLHYLFDEFVYHASCGSPIAYCYERVSFLS